MAAVAAAAAPAAAASGRPAPRRRRALLHGDEARPALGVGVGLRPRLRGGEGRLLEVALRRRERAGFSREGLGAAHDAAESSRRWRGSRARSSTAASSAAAARGAAPAA